MFIDWVFLRSSLCSIDVFIQITKVINKSSDHSWVTEYAFCTGLIGQFDFSLGLNYSLMKGIVYLSSNETFIVFSFAHLGGILYRIQFPVYTEYKLEL